jgi:hypothetical protein
MDEEKPPWHTYRVRKGGFSVEEEAVLPISIRPELNFESSSKLATIRITAWI